MAVFKNAAIHRQLQNEASVLVERLEDKTLSQDDNRRVRDEIINLKISHLRAVTAWMKNRITRSHVPRESPLNFSGEWCNEGLTAGSQTTVTEESSYR